MMAIFKELIDNIVYAACFVGPLCFFIDNVISSIENGLLMASFCELTDT